MLAQMNDLDTKFNQPEFDNNLIVIVGGFGSGKSEVSVNLAKFLAEKKSKPVAIADLDIINPYFRSREAADELEKLGIKSLLPSGDFRDADLPIIVPQVKAGIQSSPGYLILDVGGDDLGARVLSSLRDAFDEVTYDLLFVLNSNRPFTATTEAALQVMSEIETASNLKFTGIITNTHLMEFTTTETIITGLKKAHELSKASSLPLKFLSALIEVALKLDPVYIDVPVLLLDRSLLKPWERQKQHQSRKTE